MIYSELPKIICLAGQQIPSFVSWNPETPMISSELLKLGESPFIDRYLGEVHQFPHSPFPDSKCLAVGLTLVKPNLLVLGVATPI